ncbi:GNAT family N-acetyltransferase [Paenibacillus sp. KQZ6P-2]|uniref:GNAT family N-acetyltransferase n=1 Tax=Paenibacillus mangrovi TaxID=2931978 RepID=A0A9X1WJ20_9BACL|nr:GNAT family protein [Paenibacillus mangrovi]MCJ8010282.1 GNAT family N-acetyltransferase [Paenibacillus mangrovi]
MFPELTTERLRLREITPQDEERIFDCFSNYEAMRYYGQDPFHHLEEAGKLITFFADSYRDKRGIRWGMERKEEPGLIGTIGFNAWSPKHRRADIGYEIHPDYWRKGYASEAAEAIIAYGWGVMNLARIGAVVYTDNAASNAMLVKLGFQQEGILRSYMVQDGLSHDTNVYSILNARGR